MPDPTVPERRVSDLKLKILAYLGGLILVVAGAIMIKKEIHEVGAGLVALGMGWLGKIGFNKPEFMKPTQAVVADRKDPPSPTS